MSQADEILDFLLDGNSLTPLEALSRFRCLRLSGRILDLRRGGYDVQTRMIDINGKRVAQYFIPKKEQIELAFGF